MAYEVIAEPCVEEQLSDALRYIAETYSSPAVMREIFDAFEGAIDALEANPNAYPPDFAASDAAGCMVRKVRAMGYRLFYHVDDEARTVHVISFLHMRQDVPGRIRRPQDSR